MSRNLPPMSRHERAEEWRAMGRDMARMGRPDFALQANIVALQTEQTPTTAEEFFADLLRGIRP